MDSGTFTDIVNTQEIFDSVLKKVDNRSSCYFVSKKFAASAIRLLDPKKIKTENIDEVVDDISKRGCWMDFRVLIKMGFLEMPKILNGKTLDSPFGSRGYVYSSRLINTQRVCYLAAKYGRLELIKKFLNESTYGAALSGSYRGCKPKLIRFIAGWMEDNDKKIDGIYYEDCIISACKSGPYSLFKSLTKSEFIPFRAVREVCSRIGNFKKGKFAHYQIFRHILETNPSPDELWYPILAGIFKSGCEVMLKLMTLRNESSEFWGFDPLVLIKQLIKRPFKINDRKFFDYAITEAKYNSDTIDISEYLLLALLSGRLHIVQWLLEEKRKSFQVVCTLTESEIFKLGCEGGCFDVIRELIDMGYAGICGCIPGIKGAIIGGHLEIAQYLFSKCSMGELNLEVLVEMILQIEQGYLTRTRTRINKCKNYRIKVNPDGISEERSKISDLIKEYAWRLYPKELEQAHKLSNAFGLNPERKRDYLTFNLGDRDVMVDVGNPFGFPPEVANPNRTIFGDIRGIGGVGGVGVTDIGRFGEHFEPNNPLTGFLPQPQTLFPTNAFGVPPNPNPDSNLFAKFFQPNKK